MRLSLVLGLTFLLSGCTGMEVVKQAYTGIGDYFGGTDNVEPPKPLEPMNPAIKVAVLWQVGTGKGSGGRYLNLTPAVADDRVFVVDREGRVEARDRLSGAKLWKVDSDLPISAGLAVHDEKLIMGTRDAEVVALNSEDGAIAWKASVSSEVLAMPQVGQGVAVVRSSDGRITALDLTSGAVRWYHERSVPALSVRSKGSPAIAGEFVIDGYASGKLIALRLSDGKLEWETTIALPHGRSEIERLVDMDAGPVIKDDVIYVTGYQGGVAAVSLKDGEVIWRRDEISSFSGIAANQEALFLTDGASDVWQLDLRSGGGLWKQDALHQRRLTAPAVGNAYVVVADLEGYVHFLSQEDGSQLARVRIAKKPIETKPLVHDDVVYVYTTDGQLAAVSAE
jgi:outer membrane protein assembly factor BamB